MFEMRETPEATLNAQKDYQPFLIGELKKEQMDLLLEVTMGIAT